jgi:hypothetical protein
VQKRWGPSLKEKSNENQETQSEMERKEGRKTK